MLIPPPSRTTIRNKTIDYTEMRQFQPALLLAGSLLRPYIKQSELLKYKELQQRVFDAFLRTQ